MIRLNRIKGTNIGRHRLVEKEVTGNVLGLWGPSGCGKSTVLQLLEWLINGKIEHPDPIAEFVRRNEAEDIKKMEGAAWFTVDGSPMEIVRSQSRAGTATRELRWDKQGSKKWGRVEKSAAGAEALMTSLIGANQKAISSIVFIRQGAFGKLFSGLDSDRRDFFVRLLMLGHLEKIASIIDTYRKQMMGSVQDLSALRDQSEEAYRKAQAYFEEVDDALSRMRSYKPEIEAGAELVRLGDQLVSREADSKSHGAALDAGLEAADLDRGSLDKWLTDAEAKLVGLRAQAQAANGRRQSRNTYEASKARLTNEIATIRAWMEKSAKHTEVTDKLAGMASDADKPDPRVRIDELNTWERAYRSVEQGISDLAAIPETDTEALNVLRDAAAEARLAAAKASAEWAAAARDLEDLVRLDKAAEVHTEEACRLCGNEHPDPKFLKTAIAGTEALVGKLLGESNEIEDKRRATGALVDEAEQEATRLATRRRVTSEALERAKALVADAPDLKAIADERLRLQESLPAYDAAKSMRDHLLTEQRALSTSMGGVAYTQNELDEKLTELSLAEQMLETLPTSDVIEASITSITEEGATLKEKVTGLAALRDKFRAAAEAHHTATEALRVKLDELSKSRPYLISSIQALGTVITPENRDKVLAELRDKQTKFDEQTGLAEAARRSMTDASVSLQELETRIAEQQNRITIGKELEEVRAAFLPSGITTDYLSHQFRRIAVVAQDHLAQMSADFMIVASEERALSFDFLSLSEPNGSWLNQNRMSGGQQVKVAIAVLLAIHELIIPQVGLMVLDEPSTHLDTDSRIALAEVLRDIGQRGNFQLVVCDHSPELKDAYTDIIELQATPA